MTNACTRHLCTATPLVVGLQSWRAHCWPMMGAYASSVNYKACWQSMSQKSWQEKVWFMKYTNECICVCSMCMIFYITSSIQCTSYKDAMEKSFDTANAHHTPYCTQKVRLVVDWMSAGIRRVCKQPFTERFVLEVKHGYQPHKTTQTISARKSGIVLLSPW